MNTYVLSNRQDDQTVGELQFLYCRNALGQRYSDRLAHYQRATQVDWQRRLAGDLFERCGGQPLPVVVSFFIHGFNTTAQDAVTGAALYGNALYAQGLTHGIVIALSWPSLVLSSADARDNADGSWRLFKVALESLAQVQALLDKTYGPNAPRLIRAITAHGMGNLLMTRALTAGHIGAVDGAVDRVLMLAADVDHRIFTAASPVLSQGEAIYRLASGRVRVYWTTFDGVLQKDEYVGRSRLLGLRGAQPPLSPTTPDVELAQYDSAADFLVSSRYVPAEYYPSELDNGTAHAATRFVPDLLAEQLRFLQPEKTVSRLIVRLA